jgi:hypothetical protein
MIYQLRLHSDGETELDFEADQNDIQVRDIRVDLADSKYWFIRFWSFCFMIRKLLDFYNRTQLEHKSFRAYVSILYLNPKMKIFINDKEVRTRLLNRTLTKPFRYHFTTRTLATKAILELENVKTMLKNGNLA